MFDLISEPEKKPNLEANFLKPKPPFAILKTESKSTIVAPKLEPKKQIEPISIPETEKKVEIDLKSRKLEVIQSEIKTEQNLEEIEKTEDVKQPSAQYESKDGHDSAHESNAGSSSVEELQVSEASADSSTVWAKLPPIDVSMLKVRVNNDTDAVKKASAKAKFKCNDCALAQADKEAFLTHLAGNYLSNSCYISRGTNAHDKTLLVSNVA